MGTLGLNCCILTPECGPPASFTTIITDCPLPAGEPMGQEMCKVRALSRNAKGVIDGEGWKKVNACDRCRTCIAICPVVAYATLVRSYPG